jgi:predicted O-methyltransferase YrrM
MDTRSFIAPSLFEHRPTLDKACCLLFKQNRMRLPELSLPAYFDNFEDEVVQVREVPRGGWSTPLQDTILLLKLVVCSSASTLMEVGSFRGYTALSMVRHAGNDARLVTVDKNPDHGEAYQNTSYAGQIERRVGTTGPKLFAADDTGTYDLIFLDASHFYDDVRHDTELVLPLLAEDGYFVWHDYANWGYFSGHNGVPEYLNEMSRSKPVARIAGTDLAVHSPSWETSRQKAYEEALVRSSAIGRDAWSTTVPR